MARYIQRWDTGSFLLPGRWRRRYRVWFDDGFGFSVTKDGLERIVDTGGDPAGLDACRRRADEAFTSGDTEAVFEYPGGRRHPARPTPPPS